MQKLENSGDINLSLPITSTYLRQMRHKSEIHINDANDDQEDMEEDEVGTNINHSFSHGLFSCGPIDTDKLVCIKTRNYT